MLPSPGPRLNGGGPRDAVVVSFGDGGLRDEGKELVRKTHGLTGEFRFPEAGNEAGEAPREPRRVGVVLGIVPPGAKRRTRL